MKKLLVALFILILLVGGSGVAGIYYIRPDPTLTLEHQAVPLKEKALDMVKRMSLEMTLSEEDVNNILKKSLSDNPYRSGDVEVRGAKFALEGDRLIAELRLQWKNRVPAGLRVTYRLAWTSPYLTATVEQVMLKGIELPADTVEDLSLAIGQELPKPLKIREVKFGQGELTIILHKPGLADLKELIG